MKKKYLLSILLLILVSIIIYIIKNMLIADEFYITNSFSIEESKKNGAFICRYKPIQEEIKINNVNYKFNEAWIENIFHYANKYHKIEKLKSTQFIINFKSKIPKLDSEIVNAWDTKEINNCLIYNLKSHVSDTIIINFYFNNDTICILFLKD